MDRVSRQWCCVGSAASLDALRRCRIRLRLEHVRRVRRLPGAKNVSYTAVEVRVLVGLNVRLWGAWQVRGRSVRTSQGAERKACAGVLGVTDTCSPRV